MNRHRPRRAGLAKQPSWGSLFLALAGLFRAAVADDDLVDAPPSTQPAARAAPIPAPEDREGPFVVSLVNGDRITGTLVELDGERLRVLPDMAAAAVDLPLTKIDGVDRTTPPNPFEPRGDRLYPVAGGVIHGGLTDIGPRGITVDAHLVGPVTLPLDAVAAFVRDGIEQPERTAAARFHEVHDVSGSRLVGRAEFTPAGAEIFADGLTATVAIRQVAAILFPADARRGADDAAGPPRCALELINGSEVVGMAPRLERDRLVVGVGPDRSVAVPIDSVARISFQSELGPVGGRRIVFWSQFADRDEEVAHMVEALRAGLPGGWKFEADGAGPPADELAAALKTAGVLVVPEMENFDVDADVDADAVGRDVKAFLDRGGTVVIAGVDDDAAGFWDEAGIFSVSSTERVGDGSRFTIVRGHPLGRDVDNPFAAVNATFAYETEDPGLEPVARAADGKAAVLVKKVGRGAVVVLGMDYFRRGEVIDQVLVNAVTLGRGR